MTVVTVQNAKTHLSRLLRRVEAGEEVVIARGQVPVARLIAVEAKAPKGRMFGAAKGQYGRPPADAFEPLKGDDLEGWE